MSDPGAFGFKNYLVSYFHMTNFSLLTKATYLNFHFVAKVLLMDPLRFTLKLSNTFNGGGLPTFLPHRVILTLQALGFVPY